ncbi:MAG TPA: pyrroloquinoline quinone biosynthesis protein PqqE [Verrucomicrobiae bacterium]|nr:pyrroloquinoline quinone biosynthesis protein PqqE [Verrucomicrobiae bacterium]
MALQSPFWQKTAFRLAPGVRVRKEIRIKDEENAYRSCRVLLAPEKSFFLELSEAAILEFCDGEIPFPKMVETLGRFFGEEVGGNFTDGIVEYLEDLITQRLVVAGDAAGGRSSQDFDSRLEQLCAEYDAEPHGLATGLPIPRGLIAELTYRCPLHCPYCSNPLELSRAARELTTEEWAKVLREAATLGVLHVGLTGGEPLNRKDLPELVSVAREAGLYTNLLTSAVGLTMEKARQLKTAGLDSIQISFQADEETPGNEIAGHQAHGLKLAAARIVNELGFPLTVNVVIHRKNIDRMEQIIEFAAGLGARQLELANVQFYGWAMKNQAQLLPSREQVMRAEAIASVARERFKGKMEIIYVMPDYFGKTPKPCMHGWGRQYITVNPFGEALPCPTSGGIPDLRFDNVRERPLDWIWESSEAFNRFRGTDWMPQPCRSCDLRLVDFGGCRCQAALVAGDASFTDPACEKSPYRHLLEAVLEKQEGENRGRPFVYRTMAKAGRGT